VASRVTGDGAVDTGTVVRLAVQPVTAFLGVIEALHTALVTCSIGDAVDAGAVIRLAVHPITTFIIVIPTHVVAPNGVLATGVTGNSAEDTGTVG
jgi:hypothetical protein